MACLKSHGQITILQYMGKTSAMQTSRTAFASFCPFDDVAACRTFMVSVMFYGIVYISQYVLYFDNSSLAPATLSNLKYWRTSTKYLLLGLMYSKRGSVSGRSLWVYPGAFEVCRGSHPLSSLWQALPWSVYRCAGCLSRYHSSCGCNLEIHCRRPVLNFWWLHLFL